MLGYCNMPKQILAPELGPVKLCASEDLLDRGKAWIFEVYYGQAKQSVFALRLEGEVVAYLNRCAHRPAELDWQPGEFWDSSQEFILCSLHGASYAPRSGHCVGGPCGRHGLISIQVADIQGLNSLIEIYPQLF